ncbi:MAG: HAD-IIIA family hydrolase [Candidatus Kapabacteria bacterium]|nr:HAD-IIIA family hydrolase [Candidatus Kapabacteria bacterium]
MVNSGIIEKFKNVKILVMDVDGTLTDSSMYYSERGEELKRFSTRDGMGLTIFHKHGFQSAILTSENSIIAQQRAKKLKVNHVIIDSKDKSNDLINLVESLDLKLNNVAYIGDDVNDAEAMKLAGISACPADSVNLIKDIADYQCKFNGGNGAVREFIELILQNNDKPIF